MKTILMSAALFAASAIAALADPVEGTWKTIPDDNGNYGYVRITPCEARFCGQLIKAFGSDGQEVQSENVGKLIVWNMENLGDGNYGNGKVRSPDRDTIYNSKMALEGDLLSVFGCRLGICRNGGTWSRVN